MQIRIGDTTRLLAVAAIFLTFSNNAFTDTKVKPTPLDWQPIRLKNGWIPANSGRDPAVAIDGNNIVHLRGGVSQKPSGSDAIAGVLPSAFRPRAALVVPVYVGGSGFVGAANIDVDGTIFVNSLHQDDARTFTSFEGITFPRDGAPAN